MFGFCCCGIRGLLQTAEQCKAHAQMYRYSEFYGSVELPVTETALQSPLRCFRTAKQAMLKGPFCPAQLTLTSGLVRWRGERRQ